MIKCIEHAFCNLGFKIYECGIFYMQLLCMRFEQLYRKYYANRFLRCPKRCAVDNTCLTIKNLGFSLTKNFALYPKFFMKPIRKNVYLKASGHPKTAENSGIKVGNNLLFLPCANPSVHVWTMGSAKADWEGQKS